MEEKSKKVYFRNGNVLDGIIFLAIAAALLAYSLINHYQTTMIEWKTSPYLFPVLISIFLLGLAISLINDGVYQIKAQEVAEKLQPVKWKPLLFTIAAAVVYYFIMRYITFIPATILFLAAQFVFFGERRIWLIILLSIVPSVTIYFLFGVLLHVLLP